MENRVSSKENRIYRECQRLTRKKYRDREERYLIEGENLIQEAIEYGADLDRLILREDWSQSTDFPVRYYVMDRKLFDTLAQTETSQGILGIVKKRNCRKEELPMLLSHRNVVVLDRLQDPGNIGTIIRTAEGAGYGAVICLKGTADVYSPKVVRAAAGSLFRMPIVTVASEQDLFELIRSLEKRLVVTCLEGDCIYYDVNLTENIALVIGNEGNGASRSLIDQADVRLRIPMKGALESLNASVAAGILMYEAMRTK